VTSGTQYLITRLRPATMYDVAVVTSGPKGSSVPEYTLTVVTDGKYCLH